MDVSPSSATETSSLDGVTVPPSVTRSLPYVSFASRTKPRSLHHRLCGIENDGDGGERTRLDSHRRCRGLLNPDVILSGHRQVVGTSEGQHDAVISEIEVALLITVRGVLLSRCTARVDSSSPSARAARRQPAGSDSW